ncbi:hypothetical protein XOC_4471 [Xanthomonas oryzae pv. oryzicola BLS256]|uniref:Uncharacterized protein n=2 Tax=Xanthomonas oryzae TaxID=347 RepID=A0A0K0GG95_XANOP|nr:hypothetical protein PXO_03851 [Xanthomonas oryzae pv. oryzae PXO99A]AEQ98532.1 hypothetical protein XOC_4471 [Xanthomonas oryzae pv. oryzicola BLS256]QEO95249.1 hypothetical protein XOCgx_0254 [Xanthomonas oryzae pv. oryzicola]
MRAKAAGCTGTAAVTRVPNAGMTVWAMVPGSTQSGETRLHARVTLEHAA